MRNQPTYPLVNRRYLQTEIPFIHRSPPNEDR